MTTRARREEIEAAFEEALDREPAGRDAWLAARCAGDAALRAEVEALLRAHAQAEGILERAAPPPRPRTSDATLAVAEERRIGPWRVIRELGRGGMGVVYLAERADGAYRQQVAIKLLRASPDADELHRRFLAERQILASLSHPNIAQLLDGGTTDGQLPYLVMEHVDGLPITEYCDRHRLDVAARLRLFTHVCRAVHAAHQNLVIHRDLKPGNILVSEAGEPKLLDFGIAKLLNPALALPEAPHTRAAARVMTPEYASPEQVRGESLTTASDVYALGVILYELLAGRRPYELRTAAPRELQELVCEREPAAPSVAVARDGVEGVGAMVPSISRDATAAARGTSPDRLVRQLRGDVDAIVMMALRKEPRRRYGSAELLCEDIARCLDGKPVAAHRDTRAYRLRKFLGRHRAVAAALSLAALSLAAGTAVAARQAVVASRERDRAEAARVRAEQALDESERMTGFVVGLFDASALVPPGDGSGGTEELLRRGAAQVEQMATQPLAQARMLDAIGRIEASLGRQVEAEAALARSLALREAAGGGVEATSTMIALANVRRLLARYAEAESTAGRALTLRRQVLGPAHASVAEALGQLAMLAVYRSDLAGAESLAREALAIRRAALPPTDVRVAHSLELVGATVRRQGRYDETREFLREAVRVSERALGPGHPEVGMLLLRLADVNLHDLERPGEAAPLYARAVAILRATLGESHPRLGYALADQAALYTRTGDHARAIRLIEEALAIHRRTEPAAHANVAGTLGALATAHREAGHADTAVAVARAAARTWATLFGTQHPAYAHGLTNLGHALLAQGALPAARRAYEEALAIRLRSTNAERLAVGGLVVSYLGDVAAREGDLARADSLYRDALRTLRLTMRDEHRDVRDLLERLARLHEAQGHAAAAARWRGQIRAP